MKQLIGLWIDETSAVSVIYCQLRNALLLGGIWKHCCDILLIMKHVIARWYLETLL